MESVRRERSSESVGVVLLVDVFVDGAIVQETMHPINHEIGKYEKHQDAEEQISPTYTVSLARRIHLP